MICQPNRIQEFLRSVLYSFEQKKVGEELWLFSSLFLIILIVLFYFVLSKQGSWDSLKAKFTAAFFFLFIIAALNIVHIPNYTRYSVHINESQHIAEAQLLAKDFTFWKSVDGTTIGPLPLYYLAVFKGLGLNIDFLTIKMLNLLVWLFIFLSVFMIFRLTHNHSSSLLYTLPLITTVFYFQDGNFVGYNGEVLTVLLLCISVYVIVILTKETKQRKSLLFLSGIILVIIPFSKFQAGPIAFVMGLYVMWLVITRGWDFKPVISGVALPLIILLGYLWYFNIVDDFWQSYILNNAYYAAKGEGLDSNKGLLFNLAKLILILFRGIETRMLVAISFVICLLLLAKSIMRYGWAASYCYVVSNKYLLFLLLFFFLSLFVIFVPGNAFLHYSIFIFVPLILLLGWVYHKLNSLYPSLFNAWAFIILFVMIPSINVSFGGHPAFDEITEQKLLDDNEIFDYLCSKANPDDRMAVWGWESDLFAKTGIIMGTRESQTQRQILSWKQQEYYLERYLNDLETNKPRFFVDSTEKNSHLLNYETHNFKNFPVIKTYIDDNYEFVAYDDGMRLYERIK